MFSLFALILLLFLPLSVAAESSTASIYSDVEQSQSVYQIRVINKQTGKKAVIGSGFVVSRPDILATNYHVISSYITDPDSYHLDYYSTDGKTGELELLDLDVVHDLAVLKAPKDLGKPLQIAKVPKKGANLYALGNPMDLGFSIVPGTNNGVMKNSEDNNILFSGSLNPGMSGGPTLDSEGKIIGINVATSGNDVSFLVPANHLAIIIERLKLRNYAAEDDFFTLISDQLLQDNQRFIDRVMEQQWEKTTIGKFQVPSELTHSTRCWDGSPTVHKDDLYRILQTTCSNEHSIYLDSLLDVGAVDYQYQWMDTSKLNPLRFYHQYEISNSSHLQSSAGENEVTNFICHTDFIDVSGQNFKATICRRDYLEYDGLSDVLITIAMVGHPQEGFIFNLDFRGADFKAAMTLFKRMLGEFSWIG